MRRRLDAQEGDKAAPVQGQDGQHTIDHLPGELVERIELDRTHRHTHTHTHSDPAGVSEVAASANNKKGNLAHRVSLRCRSHSAWRVNLLTCEPTFMSFNSVRTESLF